MFSIYRLWLADTLFNQGQTASDDGNPGRAYNILAAASNLNPGEPFYRSELGYSAASAAVALASSEATLSAELKSGSREFAKAVGIAIAKEALKKGISNVVFDRNGFKYTGRIKLVADEARAGGLKF